MYVASNLYNMQRTVRTAAGGPKSTWQGWQPCCCSLMFLLGRLYSYRRLLSLTWSPSHGGRVWGRVGWYLWGGFCCWLALPGLLPRKGDAQGFCCLTQPRHDSTFRLSCCICSHGKHSVRNMVVMMHVKKCHAARIGCLVWWCAQPVMSSCMQ